MKISFSSSSSISISLTIFLLVLKGLSFLLKPKGKYKSGLGVLFISSIKYSSFIFSLFFSFSLFIFSGSEYFLKAGFTTKYSLLCFSLSNLLLSILPLKTFFKSVG